MVGRIGDEVKSTIGKSRMTQEIIKDKSIWRLRGPTKYHFTYGEAIIDDPSIDHTTGTASSISRRTLLPSIPQIP